MKSVPQEQLNYENNLVNTEYIAIDNNFFNNAVKDLNINF
jgi:hypothetical protein